jgi:stage IV sporulation protein FB
MMSLRLGRLKINWLLIPAVIALVALGMGDVLLCYVPAVLLHEWAHVLAATSLGMTITELELLPFGCAARLQCFAMSRGKEIMVAAAGPAANMLFACAVFAADRYAFSIAIADKLIAANLALASVNLLPALPLDGGRIARAAFAAWMGYPRATRLTAIAGIVFAVAMTGLGVFTAVAGALSPSLFVMGLFLLISAVRELKSAPFALIRDFSGKRAAIERRRTLSVNRIAAMQSEHVGDVLRAFEAGKYNVVTVLRSDMGVMSELDEREVLDSMMRAGTGTTLGSLCREKNGGSRSAR